MRVVFRDERLAVDEVEVLIEEFDEQVRCVEFIVRMRPTLTAKAYRLLNVEQLTLDAATALGYAASRVVAGQPAKVVQRGDGPWLTAAEDADQLAATHRSARRRRLTANELSDLAKRHAAGRTIEKLAEDDDRNPRTIARRLAKAKDRGLTTPG
jgi:hypothetical protein